MKRLGFGKWSAVVVVTFVAVCTGMSLLWSDYVQFDDPDPLLLACWAGMVLLGAWRVEPRRDLALVLVALFGGALIETWGTHAGLWRYFNGQAPPPFILPAWPAAALATERVVRVIHAPLGRLPREPSRLVRTFAMTLVVVLIAAWARSSASHPLTWVAIFFGAVTLASGDDPRADLARLIGGALVGYPLELWGTTSECWTYRSGGTPPLESVLAHGFATVAFARGAAWVLRALELRRARVRDAREPSP